MASHIQLNKAFACAICRPRNNLSILCCRDIKVSWCDFLHLDKDVLRAESLALCLCDLLWRPLCLRCDAVYVSET